MSSANQIQGGTGHVPRAQTRSGVRPVPVLRMITKKTPGKGEVCGATLKSTIVVRREAPRLIQAFDTSTLLHSLRRGRRFSRVGPQSTFSVSLRDLHLHLLRFAAVACLSAGMRSYSTKATSIGIYESCETALRTAAPSVATHSRRLYLLHKWSLEPTRTEGGLTKVSWLTADIALPPLPVGPYCCNGKEGGRTCPVFFTSRSHTLVNPTPTSKSDALESKAFDQAASPTMQRLDFSPSNAVACAAPHRSSTRGKDAETLHFSGYIYRGLCSPKRTWRQLQYRAAIPSRQSTEKVACQQYDGPFDELCAEYHSGRPSTRRSWCERQNAAGYMHEGRRD